MGLVAQFIGAWRHERQSPETQRIPRSRRQKFTQWAAIMFLLIHGVFAPLMLPVNALDFAMIQQVFLTRFALKLPFDEEIQAQTAILINPPLTFFTIYFPFVRAERGLPLPARQYALMSGVLGAKIMRVNDRALEIEIPGGCLQIEFDRMFRGKDALMRVGKRVALARMTAEVLSVTDEGQPARVRFTFPAPLEDRTLRFVVWKNRQPVVYKPPSIGESETLPCLPFF